MKVVSIIQCIPKAQGIPKARYAGSMVPPGRLALALRTLLLAILVAGTLPQNAPAQTPDQTLAHTSSLPVTGTTVTPATLQQALDAAAPGSILDLVGGDYGDLSLRGLRGAGQGGGAPLVLRSADPGNPARFSTMTLSEVDDILLEGIVFDYRFTPGDPGHLRPFQILDSRNVTIRGAVFDGDTARGINPDSDGYGTAFGLGVRGSDGIAIEDSEIRGFFRGMVISDSRDVMVQGNDVHSIRMDGMNFAQVEDVVIANNHIHDFLRSPSSADHADMIQFWTNGTDTPSRNILITGNVLNSGEGLYTQSIFMRNDQVDRGLAGTEMFYSAVTIENNVILNAHLHGISVGETDGLTIRANTVVRNALSAGPADNVALWEPQIRIAPRSRNVEVLRNVARKITGEEGQADWRVADNLFVQDRSRMDPGFYGAVFVDAVLSDPRRISSFAPRPGGPLDGTGLGAPRLAEE